MSIIIQGFYVKLLCALLKIIAVVSFHKTLFYAPSLVHPLIMNNALKSVVQALRGDRLGNYLSISLYIDNVFLSMRSSEKFVATILRALEVTSFA